MQLRSATEADAGPIARAHVLAWQEAYRDILPKELLDSLSVEARRAMWAERLANPERSTGTFVVAEESGDVVGFASAGPARGQAVGFDGELYGLYLVEAHQGQGYGRALVRAAARFLQQEGFQAMMVWVLKENPTRRFYERLGGQLFGEKTITIGSHEYPEVAYGWRDLGPLAGP